MKVIRTTPNFKTHTNIIKRHTDDNGNQIVEQIYNEEKQVIGNHVVLEQIPHPHYGLEISYIDKDVVLKLIEVSLTEGISSISHCRIDYTQGKVWVHPDLEGKIIKVSYWGIGYELIHASRVYTETNSKGDISETLGGIITKSEIALKFLGELPDVIIEGREIVKAINEGKILKEELIVLIDDGNALKTGLDGAVSEGTALSDKLEVNITNAFNINETLETNILNATSINENLTSNIDLGNQLVEKTIGVNNTLTDLVEANRIAKEEIIPEIDKYDNAKFNIFTNDWSSVNRDSFSVTVAHNLNSKNVILACYNNEGKSMNVTCTVVDNNTVIIEHAEAVDATLIVNVSFRGKAGDIDGGTGGLTVSDIENVKNIPTLENKINEIEQVKLVEIDSKFNPENLLALIKTVDGENSGLDAQYLGGKSTLDYISDIGGTMENTRSLRGKDTQGVARNLISLNSSDKVILGDERHQLTVSSKEPPEHFNGTKICKILTEAQASVNQGCLSIGGFPLYIQDSQPPANINGAIWIKNA